MDTTSYFGVNLLLKNKVSGSFGELLINSYSVKKGLVCPAVVTMNLYLLPNSRKSFLIKTSDLLNVRRCRDDDVELGGLLVSQIWTLGYWSSVSVIDGSRPQLSSFNKMHRRKPAPFIAWTKPALLIDQGGCEMLKGEHCDSPGIWMSSSPFLPGDRTLGRCRKIMSCWCGLRCHFNPTLRSVLYSFSGCY